MRSSSDNSSHTGPVSYIGESRHLVVQSNMATNNDTFAEVRSLSYKANQVVEQVKLRETFDFLKNAENDS